MVYDLPNEEKGINGERCISNCLVEIISFGDIPQSFIISNCIKLHIGMNHDYPGQR